MQLGTRWNRGATPPAAVPAPLCAGVAAHDADAGAGFASWTLTFLEGRGIATADDGFVVDEFGTTGAAALEDDADDDW
ncbi:hypothetical protein [Agromyces seonyuensis]|uniref:Uncharacterized protein n=1 Tax=Agromyces seonyuensis TaxID=2662446 RepID=A0A6I4P394_9MICO|nr:hypothetical protein [Agromyces seonyuensis]MWB97787.1 hypothetical protein [Agromyces seonyuensis]